MKFTKVFVKFTKAVVKFTKYFVSLTKRFFVILTNGVYLYSVFPIAYFLYKKTELPGSP